MRLFWAEAQPEFLTQKIGDTLAGRFKVVAGEVFDDCLLLVRVVKDQVNQVKAWFNAVRGSFDPAHLGADFLYPYLSKMSCGMCGDKRPMHGERFSKRRF